MKPLLAALVVALPLTLAAAAPVAVDLPEGFTAEIVAAPPLVRHPIMATLGERGVLFVGDAAGVNLDKKGLEEQVPNRVLLLKDTDGNGTYDTSTVFADRMTFPQGGAWLNGSLYVASPPGIWKLTDHNGDGVADEREMIVGGFDYTGNAADVHGPFVHPNGRLYWCHGRKGHDVKQRDGTPVHAGLASGIWSCWPDGSDIRWHALASADNPVEIDFTPEGEVVGTVNLSYTNPRGDTITHWLHGGVYPRQDQLKAIAGLPRTLDTMPVVHNFGHVAVSGCAFYRSGLFDPQWRGNLFVTHFNTQRVTRMELVPDGATFRAVEREFLRLRNPESHLTDVLEDHDGSLLVVDTGGWFRNGCPSSMMAKPEIAGGIYRIRNVGAPGNAEPWEASTAKVWELARKPSADRVAKLTDLLADPDDRIAHAAANALGSIAAPESEAALAVALNHKNLAVRLAVASALGALPKLGSDTVHALLAQLEGKLDEPVEHQVMFALIRSGEAQSLLSALRKSTQPTLQRRVLTVLNQLPDSPIKPADVLPLLDSSDTALAGKAVDIIHERADWMNAAEKHLANWVTESSTSSQRLDLLEKALVPWMKEPFARELVSRLMESPEAARQKSAWRLIANSSSPKPEPGWTAALQLALREASPVDLPQLLDACAKVADNDLRGSLEQIASNEKLPLTLRLKALGAAHRAGTPIPKEPFALLTNILRGHSVSSARMEAARILVRGKLDKSQLVEVASALPGLGPVELREAVKLLRQSKDAEVGTAFAAAMKESPALGSLPESEVRTAFSDYPAPVFAPLSLALQSLAAQDTARRRKLDEWPTLAASTGRSVEGQKAFEAGKGACIACHRVGEKGATIGPDLSRIGQIRTERDLIESILFPSASLARDYEAQVVETAGGQSFTGVIRENHADAIVLTDPSGQQHRLVRDQIISMHPALESLMPAGLDLTLSEQEIFDLVAYLRSRK